MPQNIAPPGLISLLAAALAQQPTKPLVLALDGRCGSGKTTLANTLARQFPASITLHTDDFTCRLHSASAAGRKRPAPIWTLTACGTKPCAQPTRASRCSTVPIPAARVRTCPRGSWPRSRW